MPYSAEVARVLGEPRGVLAGMSGAKAAIKLAGRGYELSDQTLIDARNGKFGRNGETLRQIARGLAPEFQERFGEEIGGVGPDAVESWLLRLGFPDSGATTKKTSEIEALAEAVERRLSQGIQRQLEELMQRKLPDETVAQYVLRRVAELNTQYGRGVRLAFREGVENLTLEEAEEILADAEEQLKDDAKRSSN